MKLSQLVGDVDRERNQPTQNLTCTRMAYLLTKPVFLLNNFNH